MSVRISSKLCPGDLGTGIYMLDRFLKHDQALNSWPFSTFMGITGTDHVFPNPRTPPAQCIAYASARKIFLDYETLHRTPLDKKPPGDHHY